MIEVLLFGVTKDIAKASSLTIKQEEVKDVGALKSYLFNKFPEFQQLQSLAFAVNGAYADPDQKLTENDEIALIPPVSGG